MRNNNINKKKNSNYDSNDDFIKKVSIIFGLNWIQYQNGDYITTHMMITTISRGQQLLQILIIDCVINFYNNLSFDSKNWPMADW